MNHTAIMIQKTRQISHLMSVWLISQHTDIYKGSFKKREAGQRNGKNCQNVCQVHRKTMEKQCYALCERSKNVLIVSKTSVLKRVSCERRNLQQKHQFTVVQLALTWWSDIMKKTTDLTGTTTDERSEESQLYSCESQIFAHSMTPLNHHNQAVNSELTDLFLKSESAGVKFSPQECCWVLPLV